MNEDDFGWEGCPHGVIEGRCAECRGDTAAAEEERRKHDAIIAQYLLDEAERARMIDEGGPK